MEDKDYIVLLEDAVHSAINAIEFMHGCLTDDRFQYAYPQMTVAELTKLKRLVPKRTYCVHSRRQPDTCESCRESNEHRERLAKIGAFCQCKTLMSYDIESDSWICPRGCG